MFKVYVLIALFIAGVAAQEANEASASAEPYSYGYETESHAASEQRDPQGKVTGFYTLVDADGRQRRVEYYADESGFHAKVATNEVGTKSQNSADVEVVASPPTEAQFSSVQVQQSPAYKQQVVNTQQAQRSFTVQQQQPQQQFVTTTSTYQQPAQQARYVTVQQQQPQAYGYTQYSNSPGYGYGSGYGSSYGSSSTGYGAGYGSYGVGNYNNHLPSQYYRSVQTSSSGGPVVSGGASRYVSTVSQQPAVSTYRSSYGYQNAPGAVTYSSGSVPAGQTTTTTRTVSSSSNSGSSNYLVLRK